MVEAIASGVLASLTWSALVWLSPDQFLPKPPTWLMGAGLLFLGNSGLWLILTALNIKIWWLWLVMAGVVNSLVNSLLPTDIPFLWRRMIHPLILSGMNLLLAGALGGV